MRRVDAAGARVSREAFWDQRQFDLEMERIFGRVWLFAAHESEVATPGDYITRRVGGEDVIVTRDEAGECRVFLNSCPHRGTQLCRADIGNTSHFRCSYHGWTFANSGRLRGVPERNEVFAADFDKSNFNLVEPPHVDVFEGLIFISWNPDAPPLREELADLTWYLEAFLSKGGSLEVAGPPARMLVRTNWKIGADNFCGDGYHLATTHKSAIDMGTYLGTHAVPQLRDADMSQMRGRCVLAGNGHTLRVQRYTLATDEPAFLGFPEEGWPQIDLMSGLSVLHGNLFPNLSFIESCVLDAGDDTPPTAYQQIRVWEPVDSMHCELVVWTLVPDWFTDEQRMHSQRVNIRMIGLAGLFDTDDFQNWVSLADMNRGRMARTGDFVYEGGVHHARDHDIAWPGAVYHADHSEVNQRELYRRWAELMETGERSPEEVSA
jgi:PAH dioxygenase large subunit